MAALDLMAFALAERGDERPGQTPLSPLRIPGPAYVCNVPL